MTFTLLPLPQATGQSAALPAVFFDRRELAAILDVYGRMVAKGEWRDYAIDQAKDKVAFAIYRRTSDVPLFRIEKKPKLARKQGAYAILGANGQLLRRGSDLEIMLRFFSRKSLALTE
jgi:hypothetical protein